MISGLGHVCRVHCPNADGRHNLVPRAMLVTKEAWFESLGLRKIPPVLTAPIDCIAVTASPGIHGFFILSLLYRFCKYTCMCMCKFLFLVF